MTEVVLDIETVPLPVEEREIYISSVLCRDSRKRKPRETPALHPCTAKVVCVGIKPVGEPAMSLVSGNEKELLERAKGLLEKLSPVRYVTYNGTGFDFPMLRFRALSNGVVGLGRLLPVSRSPVNYDIYDLVRWSMPISLSDFGYLMGVVKGNGVDVEKWYAEGDFEKIEEYNIRDLEITERIYLMRNDLLGR
jgi:DNA polymerase elongation subunit (family B)